jgi:hypothetical protein
MSAVRINEVGFLNQDTPEHSIGRLGMSSLPGGVSPLATVALVRLTCQAHGVKVGGLGPHYEAALLKELHSIRLIFWPGGDTVQMV